ncbi:MAG TPA: putative DNA-binding domain-containing protein [Candidatus Limnocylindrales bacterium]|nr:putative DNA-binding domain-containing protein [Candidatus Limnocylindrales bacterium]
MADAQRSAAAPEELRRTQAILASFLTGRRDAAREDLSLLERHVRGPQRANARTGITAYAAGYPARIREALAETFEAVEHVAGAAAFTELTLRYVRACPPRSYNLNHAGNDLPRFLATDRLAEQLPFLPDLAELELRIAQAFHADVEPAFDPAALAGWDEQRWEEAVLRFQPSLAVVTSRWPLRAIWRSRSTAVQDVDIALNGRPERVLIWKSGLEVQLDDLEEDAARALSYLRAGTRLGATMEALCERGAEPAAVLHAFARWTAMGLITTCT